MNNQRPTDQMVNRLRMFALDNPINGEPALINAAADEIEKLRAALEEAMEWNWLDPDVPAKVIQQCEDALK